MKLKNAKLVVEKSKDWQSTYYDESDELSLHKDYSGRGMYGRTTPGVSGSEYRYNLCIIDVVQEMVDNEEAEKVVPFLTDMLGAGTDSLGMGTIWY